MIISGLVLLIAGANIANFFGNLHRPPACSRRAGGLSPVIRLPETGGRLLVSVHQELNFWGRDLLLKGQNLCQLLGRPAVDARRPAFPPARLLHAGGIVPNVILRSAGEHLPRRWVLGEPKPSRWPVFGWANNGRKSSCSPAARRRTMDSTGGSARWPHQKLRRFARRSVDASGSKNPTIRPVRQTLRSSRSAVGCGAGNPRTPHILALCLRLRCRDRCSGRFPAQWTHHKLRLLAFRTGA